MFSIHLPGEGGAARDRPTPPDQPLLSPARFVLPAIPAEVLECLGARVLSPTEAAFSQDAPTPQPTIYRATVLLLPDPRDPAATRQLNSLLAPIGVRIDRYDHPVAELAPTGRFRENPVDAWTTLQFLRASVPDLEELSSRRRLRLGNAEERRQARALIRIIGGITLDHVLVGSGLDGSGSGTLTGTNTATNGSPDLGGLFNGTQPGTSGRIPVTVVMPPPARPAVCHDQRRPVVAVLDTGIATDPEHPWLAPLSTQITDGDAVVLVDPTFQDTITRVVGFRDWPETEEPLRGLLSTHAGHGTAIAGVIRQLAPVAQIYVMRVMQPYGFAHESDVCRALERIAEQTSLALDDPDTGKMVDVVSLSLGYFHETPQEVEVTGRITEALRKLTSLGVTVVAAAGNFSTSREFYPAALSPTFRVAGQAPLISVGALNPDGSTAMFSNGGAWVDCYASGTAVVTTFPRFSGSLTAGLINGRRHGYDPDSFLGMFGLWSGCSFSTPGIAGCLAGKLGARPVARGQSRETRLAARITAARDAWTAVKDDRRFKPPWDGDR